MIVFGMAPRAPEARRRDREGIMQTRIVARRALACAAGAGAAPAVSAADVPPPWAYGFASPPPPGAGPPAPNPPPTLDNVTLHTVPGSQFSFTRAQIANRYGPA